MDQRAFLKAAGAGAAATHGLEQRTMDKVTWRLLPILIVCFLINYLDRVNVGFANATMSKDLGLSATAFGGAGHATIKVFKAGIAREVRIGRLGGSL
jgi:MFS transporter, ACS family, tartrate transporter